MEQALAQFEQYLRRRSPHSSTIKHYMSDLYIFANQMDEKTPRCITPEDIDTFITQQSVKGLSPTTINRRLGSIRALFEYLASENLADRWPNPVIWRRHRLKIGTLLPRDAKDQDITRLFTVITDVRDQAILSLMVGGGLRVAEVASLRCHSLEIPEDPHQLAQLRVFGKGSKERIVWLIPSLTQSLQAWIKVRPEVVTEVLFLNRHGQPITVSGIQYRLKQHCQLAGVKMSCHQLRHTYARRLTENGLPIESLARLLGHSQLHTTQRYTNGADPTLRAEFHHAMQALQESLITSEPLLHPRINPLPTPAQPRPRRASQDQLEKLHQKTTLLPLWMREVLQNYLNRHWTVWRAQTAYMIGYNIISALRQMWRWLDENRQIDSWETFQRADLEAWLQARLQEGVTNSTIATNLGYLRMLLKFMETREYDFDPGLFRVRAPKSETPLPRYVPEADYRQLETFIMQQTQANTYDAYFDRAWFLTFAHTGLRRSEVLDWRLDDLNLTAGLAAVRGSKSNDDRMVYLTPPLIQALDRYLSQRPDNSHSDHVYLKASGHRPGKHLITERLKKYAQQIGLYVTPHQLRHTFATRLLNQGVPMASLQKLLGHKKISNTQIYAQIYDETLYQQFQTAISSLNAIPVEDWPQQVQLPIVAHTTHDDTDLSDQVTIDNSV